MSSTLQWLVLAVALALSLFNGSQIDPDGGKNGSQIDPNGAENRSQIDPDGLTVETDNRSQIDPNG
jgi:hypothetical protein